MPRQPLKLRPSRCVPHIPVAIIPSAYQPCPIWAPGHATDPGRELTARPAPRARCRCHIPHLHSLQIGSAGQVLPVWTPGHTIEEGVGAVEVPQDLQTGPGGWIPESYGTIRAGTGEQAVIETPRQAAHRQAMAPPHPSTPPTGPLPQA